MQQPRPHLASNSPCIFFTQGMSDEEAFKQSVESITGTVFLQEFLIVLWVSRGLDTQEGGSVWERQMTELALRGQCLMPMHTRTG